MKLISIILNVVVSPVILVALIYYFYRQDFREAVLLALLVSTVLTCIQLVFKLIKVFLSTITFNVSGAIKNTSQILTSLGIIILYWLVYYFYFGANFVLNI